MEKLTRLVNYQVDYICDVCGIGVMRVEKNIISNFSSSPLSVIQHRCDNCTITRFLPKQYPSVVMVPEEEAKNFEKIWNDKNQGKKETGKNE